MIIDDNDRAARADLGAPRSASARGEWQRRARPPWLLAVRSDDALPRRNGVVYRRDALYGQVEALPRR